jgi:hypothetical protein
MPSDTPILQREPETKPDSKPIKHKVCGLGGILGLCIAG